MPKYKKKEKEMKIFRDCDGYQVDNIHWPFQYAEQRKGHLLQLVLTNCNVIYIKSRQLSCKQNNFISP